MNLPTIRAELEDEQTWRQNEIRFLRNQLANVSDPSEKMQFRRALVLMLYAHYEGYCKFALLQYLKTINQEAIRCEEATSAIVAGAWSRIFTAMERGDQTSEIFRNSLPEDARLHRFARRRDFIEQFSEFAKQIARIPEETIDTESNLHPIVMQKNLYLLGLDHNLFSKHDGDILHLIYRRNNISHGSDKMGLTESEYERLESAVFKIMDDLMDIVMEAMQKERYKR
ncbi:MAG: MAE_28990/MAE_18760 family HEPN-like nuclease [Candidatus Entotheonellia bacterium]